MKPRKRKTASKARKPGDNPGAGNGGTVPPAENRYPRGQSGNPAGRPSAGATLIEQYNLLGQAKDMTEEKLRRIARNPGSHWIRRAAAERALRTIERADVADFDQFITGKKTLKELREAGINTEVVKKASNRPTENGDARSVELHDRAGEAQDKVIGHTHGNPTQSIRHEGSVDIPDAARAIDRGNAGLSAVLALAGELGIKRPPAKGDKRAP